MTKHSIKRKAGRFGSLSNRNEVPGSMRRDHDEPVIIKAVGDAVDSEGGTLVQRCVIIQRDERGYGLTVSGDNPVFVQSVKDDGAAARAGVQRGDRIIKVNGTLVTQSNHVEVVKLIKSGSYVALTLLSRTSSQHSFHGHTLVHSPSSSPPTHPAGQLHHHHSFHQASYHPAYPHHHGNMNATNRSSITGPIPVDQQINHNRVHTMKQMLEQDLNYVAKLRSEYAKNPSDKIKMELEIAVQRVKQIEDKLCMALSQSNNRQSSKSPNSVQSPPSTIDSCEPPPPPPPRRHTSLPHQTSLPNAVAPPVPMRVESKQQFTAPNNSCDSQELSSMDTTPTSTSQYPLSHSMDNIQKINAWMASGGPTHSRQRSSPDAILHHVENIKQNRSPDLSRSHSDVTSSRKIHSADSFSDLESKRRKITENNTSRASSFGAYDSTSTDSPRVTPPGTPPPPYSTFEKPDVAASAEEEISRPDEPSVSPVRNCGTDNVAGDRRSGCSDSQGNATEAEVVAGVGFKVSPYGAPAFSQHTSIMTMEEEDCQSSDNELALSDDHGPFNSWQKLKMHHGHLSVFLHYLICNSDPSTAFFHLISTLYKEGNIKDMKKWAYEIHSTFLVPVAPLKVNNIDDNVLHEIGIVLQKESDKEDVLRRVFSKARKKALEELNEQLADFRNKRAMGLASLYGPTDSTLEEAIHDKNKEIKIIEMRLLKCLDSFSEDLDNAKDRDSAMASALATVLYKVFGIKSPQAMAIIERCPQFVAKDTRSKGIKFLKGSKKFVAAHGHHFIPQHYQMVTYCNHCQLIIWGVGNQGYQCQYCEMNIHKTCVRVVEETCAVTRGAHKKDKKKDRVAGLMENIIKGRKPSQTNPGAIERARRFPEELSDISSPLLGIIDIQTEGSGDKGITSGKVEKLRRNFESVNENEDRLAPSNGKDVSATSPGCSGGLNLEGISHTDGSKKGSVVRSESLKTRREAKHSFRKRSDPNIPRSNSDIDGEDRATSGLNHSGSSSNSSLSAHFDSPSNSLEAVHKTTSTDVSPQSAMSPSAPSQVQKNMVSSINLGSKRDDNDSDFDVEPNPPNWIDGVDREIIRHMKPKEKKRQDVINELLHTERTHVRNLKVLDKVFYRPMQNEQVLPSDQIKLLFPNLEAMIEIHSQLNNRLKLKKRESPIVGDIGDILLEMFDGAAGENFREAAATFCKNQSIALEALKVRQKKDQKLAQFLADASSSPYCRRFELKDIIPTAMQRLTKYPLLLENLAKYTCPTTSEYKNITRAVDCSKQILNYVNEAVKEAENCHRLSEWQKKIDWGPFEKSDHPISHEFKNLDLTKQRMIHEGYLQWRINRQKLVDLHVLLLEDIFVLLQKQDEKHVLKFHSTSVISGRDETKQTHSPIIRVGSVLTRNVATDKRAFFLVSTQNHGPQIYELVAISTAEQKTWLRHITEATETYKAKEGKVKIPESVPVLDTEPNHRAEETPVEDSIKVEESSENTESQDGDNSRECLPTEMATPEAPDHPESSTITSPKSNLGDGARNSASGGTASESDDGEESGAASSSSTINKQRVSPSPQRRFQRVEILQIAEGPPLIEPSEVIISERAVLQTAEPVLAPIEKLRRQNQLIKTALKEKHNIVGEILNIPSEDIEKWSHASSDNMEGTKDVKELVVAAMVQASRLTEVINDNLSVSEEDAISAGSEGAHAEVSSSDSLSPKLVSPKPGRKAGHIPSAPIHTLLSINNYLGVYLTQLLSLVTERENERQRLRSELRSSREQIHRLHDAHRRTTPVSQSPTHSRPNSFVSISSSASELCDTTEHIQGDDLGDDPLTIPSPAIEDLDDVTAFVAPVDTRPPCIIFEAYNSNVDLSGGERHVELFVDAPSESSTDPPSELSTDLPCTDIDQKDLLNHSPKPELETVIELTTQVSTTMVTTTVEEINDKVLIQPPPPSLESTTAKTGESGAEF
ncbi:hypothetical protein CHUAL_001722 [Chamberlinius hualienensis]